MIWQLLFKSAAERPPPPWGRAGAGAGIQIPKNVCLCPVWKEVYFYPKDATPGCTTEGQDFAALHTHFTALGAQIVGVSRDSLASHEKFRVKQQFPFELVSDPEEILCRAFDVIKEKHNYGKTYMGIERSTFLLNPQGEVVRAWRKVKVAGHAEEVLQALRAAQG